VFDSLPTLLTQYIVDIQKFRMTGIRHAMVTHKDNIYNVAQVARYQRAVQVSRERINVFQRILYAGISNSRDVRCTD
jgi:hypothetical protein